MASELNVGGITTTGNVGVGTSPTAIASYTALTISGDYGGVIDLKSGSTEDLRLLSQSTQSFVGTQSATPLILRTAGAEAVRIDSTGNVGVGISPTKKLTVYGTGVTDAGIATVQIEGEGGADPTLNFLVNNTTHWAIGADDSDGDSLKICQHSAVGSTNNFVTIDSAGNVQVGGTVTTAAYATTLGVTDGTTARVLIKSTGAGGREYGMYTGTAGNLGFYDYDDDSNRLSISSAGLATFSKDILAGANAVPAVKLNVGAGDNVGWVEANHITGTGSGNYYAGFKYDGGVIGSISQSGTAAVAYNTTSDYRLKENVTPMTGALDRLDLIPVYNFNFKADPGRTVDGFLAHEVAAHVPEAIHGTKDEMETVVTVEAVEAVTAVAATYYAEGDELPDGVAIGDEKTPAVEAVDAVVEVTEEQPKYQGIDQSKLVPLMLAAIKELKAKVTVLENA